MDFGTAIHQVIEAFFARDPDVPYDIPLLCFLFENQLRYLYEKNREKYKPKDLEVDFGGLVKSGQRIITDFMSCDELRKGKVLYNEFALMEPIDRTDGLSIKFKGFIDLVLMSKSKRGEKVIYVVDFKTCSWGWDREKREDKERHFQILLYKHFFAKKFGVDPKLVRTAFVLLKRTPRGKDKAIEFFPISAGPVSTERAVVQLNRDITELHERYVGGTLKKNRLACVNDFGEVCPFKGTAHCPEGPERQDQRP